MLQKTHKHTTSPSLIWQVFNLYRTTFELFTEKFHTFKYRGLYGEAMLV